MPALALTLIIALDVPFRGPVKVNLDPLATVAETLVAEPLSR